MKAKVIIVATLVILMGIGIIKFNSTGRAQQAANQQTKKRGTLAWHVQQAKSQGKKKVVVPVAVPIYAAVSDSQDALSRFSVIVAQPIEKRTFVRDSSALVTWYKFKLIENLSQPSNPECPGCLNDLSAPAEMFPLQPDEILVPVRGGDLVIDGVQVINKGSDDPQPFSNSRRYLLFLSLDVPRQLGLINVGYDGIFYINTNDLLEPVVKKDHPLKKDLAARWGNSLEKLKAGLPKKP